jgi:methylmalonyl-CoA/ethylmalonyl-CoA epimerase
LFVDSEETIMLPNLDHIGQIGLPVADIEWAEAFYGDLLGLRKLFRFGDLTFFDCASVRLLLEKARDALASRSRRGTIYLRCADIAIALRELKERGLECQSARKKDFDTALP